MPPLASGKAPVTVAVASATVNPAPVAPDVSVPVPVMLPCTADGRVEEIDGTPPADVISTPLLPVVTSPNVPPLSKTTLLVVPPVIGLLLTVSGTAIVHDDWITQTVLLIVIDTPEIVGLGIVRPDGSVVAIDGTPAPP